MQHVTQLRRHNDFDRIMLLERADFLDFMQALPITEFSYLLTGWVGGAELLRRYTREIVA